MDLDLAINYTSTCPFAPLKGDVNALKTLQVPPTAQQFNLYRHLLNVN
jgi:hypothetical protein